MPTLKTDLTLNVSNFISNINKSVQSAGKLGDKLASVASTSSASYDSLSTEIAKVVAEAATASEAIKSKVADSGFITNQNGKMPVYNNKKAAAGTGRSPKISAASFDSSDLDGTDSTLKKISNTISNTTSKVKENVSNINMQKAAFERLGSAAYSASIKLLTSSLDSAKQSQGASGLNAKLNSLAASLKLVAANAGLSIASFATLKLEEEKTNTTTSKLIAKLSSIKSTVTSVENLKTTFSKLKTSASEVLSKVNSEGLRLRNTFVQLSANVEQFSNKLRGVTSSGSSNMSKLNGEVKSLGLNFKSAANIAAGIMISQAFYSATNAIKSAASSLVDFYGALENAKVVYANFMGSTDLATNFTNVLQDFAAKTPVSFEAASQSAQRLLAYGIQYKNLMFVMQGAISAASAYGDDSKIEPITRALGQIYTKGKVKAEELRQLAEAGIPAYEILREKLHLTADEVANIGKANIPASTAINALVEGMQERYGGLVNYMNQTLTGLLANMKDIGLQLGGSIFEPVILQYKKFIAGIVNGMLHMQQVYETSGLGGVFEDIVPKNLQAPLRNLVAALMNLVGAFKILKNAVGSLISTMGPQLIPILNGIVVTISQVILILASAIAYISGSKSAITALSSVLGFAIKMWLLFKAAGVAAAVVGTVAKFLSKAILGIANALSILIANPALIFVVGLGVAIAFLTGQAGKLMSTINGIASSMKSIGGVDSSKILLPEQKQRNEDLDTFNNELDTTADKMGSLADSTSKAAKAASSLYSFDEVFSPTKASGVDSGTGASSDDETYTLPTTDISSALPDLDTDSWISTIDSKCKDAVSKLKEKLASIFGDSRLTTAVSTALGASIGGGIGYAIGGIPGMIIGAFVGGGMTLIKDTLLQKLGEAFGIDQESINLSKLGSTIAAIPVFILTTLASGLGLLPALAVTFISGCVLGIMGMFKPKFDEWINDPSKGGNIVDGAALGTAIGAGIGLAFGPAGVAIGAVVGALVGGLVGRITTVVGETDWGAAFEDVFSFSWAKEILGYAGDCFKQAWEDLKNGKLGSFLLNVVKGIGSGLFGATEALVEPIAKFFNKVYDFFCRVFGIHSPATKMKPIGKNIILGVAEGLPQGLKDCLTALGSIGTSIISTVDGWKTDVVDSAKTLATDAGKHIKDFATTAGSDISTFATSTYSTVSGWKKGATTAFLNFKNEASSYIKTWYTNVTDKVSSFATDTYSKIKGWYTDSNKKFADFKDNTFAKVSTWYTNTKAKIDSFADNSYSKIKTWYTDTNTKFKDFKDNTYNKVKTWESNAGGKVKTFADNATSELQSFFNTSGSFSSFTTNTYNTVATWASNMWSSISSNFTSIIGKLKEFFAFDGKSVTVSTNYNNVAPTPGITWTTSSLPGHAMGGIFNRAHVASFSEGNKKEAIIPLENKAGMQPFVDTVTTGVIQAIAPMIASSNNNQNNLQPLYVGTLIADERSLKELNRKMQVIQIKETDRRN